jgi:hypothetical protein
MSDWVRVSRHNPCPVCQSDTWCTYTTDGNVVRCTRAQSESESTGKDGAPGWLHFDQPIEIVRVGKPPKKPEPIDASPIARQCYEAGLQSGAKAMLADSLGVSEESLNLLRVGVGEDHDGSQWFSFPSRDGDGKVIGITRRYPDGHKKTYCGTSNGIFMAHEWYNFPGVVLIVEGASDVAAATTHGLCALGRSSNLGGIHFIQSQLAKHAAGRPVIVIGERDEKPEKRGRVDFCPADCSGCNYCYPGKFGAEHVAKQLGVNHCMPIAPYKDLREMLFGNSVWVEALRCLTPSGT